MRECEYTGGQGSNVEADRAYKQMCALGRTIDAGTDDLSILVAYLSAARQVYAQAVDDECAATTAEIPLIFSDFTEPSGADAWQQELVRVEHAVAGTNHDRALFCWEEAARSREAAATYEHRGQISEADGMRRRAGHWERLARRCDASETTRGV